MSRPEKRSVDLEATESMAKAKQSDPNLQEVKQDGGITRAGLKVLVLLAFQNCVKNLVMRAAVSGDAHFLYSAAVIATVFAQLSALGCDRGRQQQGSNEG